MSGQSIYMDTSSIVKRYVSETGSELADIVYAKAEAGTRKIITSIWSIGEVLGALDIYRSRKLISEVAFHETVNAFLAESEKMLRLGGMQIIPLTSETLVGAYGIILKHHVYEADAVQLATSKASKSAIFLSADKPLLAVAKAEEIYAFDIEVDAERIMENLA